MHERTLCLCAPLLLAMTVSGDASPDAQASARHPAPATTSADPRRDMIAVLRAPGPHPSLGDQARVFNHFVGTWDCDYSFIAEDGTVRHSPRGAGIATRRTTAC